MDESFKVLQKKEIYEFLEGSGDQELVQHNDSWYKIHDSVQFMYYYHSDSTVRKVLAEDSIPAGAD